MNVFISVPMHGRSDNEIWEDINAAFYAIPKIFPERKPTITHNLGIPWNENSGELYYFGQTIQMIDKCDAVYFCPNWRTDKECLVEHYICELYGIQRIEA